MWSAPRPISGGRTRSRALSYAATSAAGRLPSRPPTWRPPFAAIPADGVYAGWLTAFDSDRPELARRDLGRQQADVRRDGAGRRGLRAGQERFDLYGTHVAVDFATKLRAMVRFDSADDLVAQMHRDVDRSQI